MKYSLIRVPVIVSTNKSDEETQTEFIERRSASETRQETICVVDNNLKRMIIIMMMT